MAKVDTKQGTFYWLNPLQFSVRKAGLRPYPSLNTTGLAKKIEKETWKAGWELWGQSRKVQEELSACSVIPRGVSGSWRCSRDMRHTASCPLHDMPKGHGHVGSATSCCCLPGGEKMKNGKRECALLEMFCYFFDYLNISLNPLLVPPCCSCSQPFQPYKQDVMHLS